MIGLKKNTLLSSQDLSRIAQTIAEVEKQTSGEIRVSVRMRRAWNERTLSLHKLALKEFYQLGMEKTKEKTGVLLFLLVKEKVFHIIADEGIHMKVGDMFWDTLASEMSSHFKDQKFCEGICNTVIKIGEILKKEFPQAVGDTNELSNDVVIT